MIANGTYRNLTELERNWAVPYRHYPSPLKGREGGSAVLIPEPDRKCGSTPHDPTR